MPRKPRESGGKEEKPKALPAIVKCGEPGCPWSRAILPGQNAPKLLTRHYQEKHAS